MTKRLLAMLLVCVGCSAFAATTSQKTAGTCDEDASSWTSETNAQGSDNTTYASHPGTSGTGTLRCYNFGFTSGDIPEGSTINGITVDFGGYGDGNNGPRRQVTLVPQSSSLSADCTSGAGKTQDFTVSDANYQLGGAADLWSCSDITQAVVTGTNFGIRITSSGQFGSGYNRYIDWVGITIDYTATATRKRLKLVGTGN